MQDNVVITHLFHPLLQYNARDPQLGECFIGSSAYIAIMDGMNGLLLLYN